MEGEDLIMTKQGGMGLQAVRDPTREKEKRARENRECRRQAAFIKVSGSVPYKIQKNKNKKSLTLIRMCKQLEGKEWPASWSICPSV